MEVVLAEKPTVCNDRQQQSQCRSKVENNAKATSPVAKDKYSVIEEKRTTVRKGLGCRRSLNDMLSPEDQENSSKNANQQDKTSQKRHPSGKGRSSRGMKPRRRLIFSSPRLTASDEELFPSDPSLYKEASGRWQQISIQAGSHRQDGTVMNIGRRPSTAKAFRKGMIPCAAIRVRSLNLWVDHENDTLLDWLQMIAETFVNLEHLTLTQDLFPGEDEMAVSARMRRLYVLSILPNLKSIDDMVVTSKEREMANPGHCSDEVEMEKSEPLSPNCESIGTTASNLVLIDNDSIRTCRANGIEVEFLSEKCWEVKQTETDTTASSSPTSSVEDTIAAINSDGNSEFNEQNELIGASPSNDTITATQVPSINSSPDNARAQDKNATRNTTSGEDRFRPTVRALNSAANESIELVPVARVDPLESSVCVDKTNTAAAFQACSPVQRQSKVVVPTPQVACCQIYTEDPTGISQFLFPPTGLAIPKDKTFSLSKDAGPPLTANQRLPPSKSLSSPFPMQFRERQKTSSRSTGTHLVVKMSNPAEVDSLDVFTPTQNGIEVIARESPQSSRKEVSQFLKTAQKGDLPPTCPFGKNQQTRALNSQSKQQDAEDENEVTLSNHMRHNARSTSVMDFDDDEEVFPVESILDDLECDSCSGSS